MADATNPITITFQLEGLTEDEQRRIMTNAAEPESEWRKLCHEMDRGITRLLFADDIFHEFTAIKISDNVDCQNTVYGDG